MDKVKKGATDSLWMLLLVAVLFVGAVIGNSGGDETKTAYVSSVVSTTASQSTTTATTEPSTVPPTTAVMTEVTTTQKAVQTATTQSTTENTTTTGRQVTTTEPESTLFGDSDNATAYILNTNTMKFHYPYCPSVLRMHAENKREFSGSRESVIAEGFVPCKKCCP